MYDWNRNEKNSGFLRAYRNYNHYYNYGHMYEMDWAVEGQQNVALSDTNRLLAGAEFRHASVNNTDFYDEKKSYENRSLYLQDQLPRKAIYSPSLPAMSASVAHQLHSFKRDHSLFIRRVNCDV